MFQQTPNAQRPIQSERGCQSNCCVYLSRLMPKPISRSKTRKAVAKRFKITGRGKILRSQSSRRHLLSSKNAKRKRHLGKMARVDKTDEARVRANLPFGKELTKLRLRRRTLFALRLCGHLPHRFVRIRRRFRAVKIASVSQRRATQLAATNNRSASSFTAR